MCGIFGIFAHPEAANITYLGLHALQHRGQESVGIVSSDGNRLHTVKQMGCVGDAFSRTQFERLPGHQAIGHVRYSTTGDATLRNAQPLLVEYAHGSMAIAHNGNLVNAPELKRHLELEGAIFSSTCDSETIIHLIARAREIEIEQRLTSALSQVEGAYSMLLLSESKMIAVRDPSGFRPLVMGRLKDSFVFASETCAFDLIEAEFMRELEPGEVVVIDAKGLRHYKPFAQQPRRFCVFEHVYFARPDSIIDNRSVYQVRKLLGEALAAEKPADADLVIPVPDSGVPAAIGYARALGLPYEMGLIRSHYVGRTFIEPQQAIRHFGVKLKLNAVREILHGKRVVVVDDSLVRGTTARKIVKMLRNAGAREVHLRIASPPTIYPCFYGIDTPTRSELIASSHTPEEIARYVTCDTLGYLSREGMMRAVASAGPDGETKPGEGYCDACYTGRYPVEFKPGAHPATGRIVN